MDVRIGIPQLGGFGDLVAAVKIGESLSNEGHAVIYVGEVNVAQKAKIIFPDVNVFDYKRHTSNIEALQINVVARLLEEEHMMNIYVREFDKDHIEDRGILVVPGMYDNGNRNGRVRKNNEDMVVGRYGMGAPMLYAPYCKDKLPIPKENIRDIITENAKYRKGTRISRILDSCSKIGVCYTSQEASAAMIVHQLRLAASESMKYGIVVIPSDYDTEHYLRGEFEGVCGFTSISSDGKVIGKTNEDVFIIVLPHQDQTTATRLFRASEMPNTVTGDNSLSDSIYSLVFENGQGFFYEERQWKRNTMRGMVDIMAAHCAEARDIFVQGSHLMYNSVNGNPIAEMLTTNSTEYYARLQREAFRRALRCDEKSDPRSVTVQGNVCRLVAAIEAYPDIVRKENISHREHLVKGRKLAVA